MNRLVIAIAYRRNPAMLRKQQEVIASYPEKDRARTLLIVCDDASAEDPAHAAAVEPEGYELQIYRILGEEKPWTHLRPRQLGVHIAPPGWLVVTDIDHTIPLETAAFLLGDFEPETGRYYTFARRNATGEETNPHCNSYLVERSWFWDEVGGLNEDYVGWYGCDSIFRARAAMFGKSTALPVPLVVWNRDGVDLTDIKGCATNLPRKNSRYHARNNPAIKARMARAHLERPENRLRFKYERMR
jgi:hypothetical protein